MRNDRSPSAQHIESYSSLDKTPNDIDWTKLGLISAVKNQGNCDAGYAFASVSLAESYLLSQGKNLTLSEQQVVDCSSSYTTMGCSGGSRSGTLQFIKDKGL